MEIRNNSWFGSSVPNNCIGSSVVFGSLPNGRITVTSTGVIGDESNNRFTLQAVAAVGNSKAMTATFANNVITITLGTNAGGALDNAKNTATLIVTEINKLAGFNATFSGDGSGVVGITAECASTNVGGSIADSFLTVTYNTAGIAGNEIKIVVEDGLANGALATTYANKVLTITLGMDANTLPDDAKNTAGAIETEINKLADFTAVADGTGLGVPAIADGNEIPFTGGTTGLLPLTGGLDATECPDIDVLLRNWNVNTQQWDYYINIAPNGKHDSNWRIFNLTQY